MLLTNTAILILKPYFKKKAVQTNYDNNAQTRSPCAGSSLTIAALSVLLPEK